MGRLRQRLDQMQGEATETLNQSQALMGLAQALLKEAEDGVEISLINDGTGTIWDFLVGKIKELPIKIKVKP